MHKTTVLEVPPEEVKNRKILAQESKNRGANWTPAVGKRVKADSLTFDGFS
jgi:hypothetical protein